MQANCGMEIDGLTLKVVDGVLTTIHTESVQSKSHSTVCGGLCYDTNVFTIANDVYTLKDDTKEEYDYIYSNCGQKFDSEYFKISDDGKLSIPITNVNYTVTIKLNNPDLDIKNATKIAVNYGAYAETKDSNVFRLPYTTTPDYEIIVQYEGYKTASYTTQVEEDMTIALTLQPND